jgi:hypothetical protein
MEGEETLIVGQDNQGTIKDEHEGAYELVLRDESNAVSETTRPGAIRLNMSLGEAQLLLRPWKLDLSPLQTDLLASVVLPSSIAPNDILHVGVKTAESATFSWTHRTGNGTITRLTTQKGPSLNFKDVIRLKGFYVLTITSGGSSRSITFQALSFATTNVSTVGLQAAAITQEPKSLVVPPGGDACFAVFTSGNVARYRWMQRKDGVDTEVIGADSSPWLTFEDVVKQDHEGTYFVEVYDAHPDFSSLPLRSVPVTLEVVPSGE